MKPKVKENWTIEQFANQLLYIESPNNFCMRIRYNFIFLMIISFVIIQNLNGQNANNVITQGPKNGSLVVVGGGKVGDEILRRFIDLAGGIDREFVIVPTAGGQYENGMKVGMESRFREFGINKITILHTRDKEVANSDSFVAPLKTANAVWFTGGRQWRLVDSYVDTRTQEEFWGLLSRGGVIGGTSAGATIQGSYLARGDTKNNQIMMGDHEEGFGFITNVAIDQHVLVRNRQFDLFNILNKRPELLGIGLDESTAIVVIGNEFEVVGDSYVLIYDQGFWSREGSDLKKLPPNEDLFYFLRPGDHYNLETRSIIEDE